jgi:hypothetical protein
MNAIDAYALSLYPSLTDAFCSFSERRTRLHEMVAAVMVQKTGPQDSKATMTEMTACVVTTTKPEEAEADRSESEIVDHKLSQSVNRPDERTNERDGLTIMSS